MVRVMNHPALALTAAILAGLLIGTGWQVYANYRATSALWPTQVAAAPVLDEHISLVLSDDGSSLQTGDPKALEDWFRARLDFSPPVPSWPWAELVGGRLSLIGGERVARMEYAAGERQFTLFVQFVGSEVYGSLRHCDSGQRAIVTQQRGYKAAYWSREGFSYVLVAHQTADPVFQHLRNER
jgi:anti-sigma factor RsiW